MDKSRLEELVQLYESLDFEVKIEPFTKLPGSVDECDLCLNGGEYFVIYTRKKKEP